MYRKKLYKEEDEYIFEGLLRCNCCDSKLIGKSGYGKNKQKYYYYYCIRCKKQISEKIVNNQFKNTQYKTEDMEEKLNEIKIKDKRLKYKINQLKELFLNNEIEPTDYINTLSPIIIEQKNIVC